MKQTIYVPVTINKTSQKLVLIVWIVVTLLFGRSVLADWMHNDKIWLPSDEIITTKPTDRWLLNENGKSQKYTDLQWKGRDARAIELLNDYWQSGAAVWSTFIHTARIHQVYPEVLLCITYADTSIGKHLKTPFNWGNVGNNDRGDKVWFKNIEQGINAIWWVLNWSYLKWKQTIWDLSPYSWGTAPFYATSTSSWEVNVLNCMWMIHNKKITWDFSFRR